jgi:hypothetical protein
MEQVLDWLNENELRAYPLLDDSPKLLTIGNTPWNLPDTLLLDLQLKIQNFSANTTITVDGSTVVVPRVIVLRYIKLTSDNVFEASFGTIIDNAFVEIEKFTIASPSTASFPVYVRTPRGNLAVFGSGVSSFIANTAVNTAIVANIPVEPATCVQFNDAWLGVSSIAIDPEKVTNINNKEPQMPLRPVTAFSQLVGDIDFLAGYNFRVNISNNLIDLEIGESYGLLMTCDTHFIAEEYRDCHELVSYINGVPPDANGTFKLVAGDNISIISGQSLGEFSDNIRENQTPEQHEIANLHTLFVGLTFAVDELCAPINVKPYIK